MVGQTAADEDPDARRSDRWIHCAPDQYCTSKSTMPYLVNVIVVVGAAGEEELSCSVKTFTSVIVSTAGNVTCSQSGNVAGVPSRQPPPAFQFRPRRWPAGACRFRNRLWRTRQPAAVWMSMPASIDAAAATIRIDLHELLAGVHETDVVDQRTFGARVEDDGVKSRRRGSSGSRW